MSNVAYMETRNSEQSFFYKLVNCEQIAKRINLSTQIKPYNINMSQLHVPITYTGQKQNIFYPRITTLIAMCSILKLFGSQCIMGLGTLATEY